MKATKYLLACQAEQTTVLGANLKRLMEERQVKAAWLAERSGRNRTYVYELLKDAPAGPSPTLETLQALATALRCRVTDLIGEGDPPATTPYDRNPAYRQLVDALETKTAALRNEAAGRTRPRN